MSRSNPRTLAAGPRRALGLIAFAAALGGAAVLCTHGGDAVPLLDIEAPSAQPAAERYVLPISPPLDQGETGLCWVFATLSMLETNYMIRHPGAHVDFSRAAVQLDSIEDRFERLIRGRSGEPSDGGLAVEALELVRRNGLYDRGDFHDVVDVDDMFDELKETLAVPGGADDRKQRLGDRLRSELGVKPASTHLDGRPMAPTALADVVLGDAQWTEFDLAREGEKGWGPSRDPDALPETLVRYVGLDALIDLIHRSLARSEAVVVGTVDHAFLVYGADYDEKGEPISYFVKDSHAPYLYQTSALALHSKLNDVTVSTDRWRPGRAGEARAPVAPDGRNVP
jgi:hypothetical protein